MAKKEKIADKRLTKEEKKLKKEAKKLKQKERNKAMETNIYRFMRNLTQKQVDMVLRFCSAGLKKHKDAKEYVESLTSPAEKELIQKYIDVYTLKVILKPIGARDLADLWKRQNFSLIGRRPEKQIRRSEPINRYEPITPGFSDSNKKPDNPKPDNQPSYEPDYDEPPRQPVKFDEKLFDELDKHSDEINKYLDGV